MMAGFKIVPYTFLAAGVSRGLLAGTVSSNGAPASRLVKIFKNNDITQSDAVYSDETTGAFSFSVDANENDRWRVEAIGAPGENSQVFERVSVA